MPPASAIRSAPAVSTLAVLDASVAVRWVVMERGSTEAADLLARDITWIAPRLVLTEIAAALRRKAAGDELPTLTAVQALDTLLQAVADGLVLLADDEDVIGAALTLALALRHKVPDCLYLALAEREGAALATADTRLATLARRRGLTVFLVPSG